MAKRWIIAPQPENCAAAAAAWRVPDLIAHILLNRGVAAEQSCQGFLTPQLKDLHPPAMLPGAEKAAAVLADAVKRKRKIVIYGDYDVDGTVGVAILWHALRLAGCEAHFYVPHRIEEGYGLNRAAVSRLVDDGAELIATVDCGVTAVEIADELRQRGVPLIITDHHAPRETLPQAAAIVHPALGGAAGGAADSAVSGPALSASIEGSAEPPRQFLHGRDVGAAPGFSNLHRRDGGATPGSSSFHRRDGDATPANSTFSTGCYPNPHLCGAGVAFKLAWAFAQRVCGAERVDAAWRELLQQMLPLAALGTIADVVPLTGENRVIARHGLSGLPHSAVIGVRALIESAGLSGEKINAYDVGFKLAPRINAAGRMGHARLAVELFTRADATRAAEIAAYLEGQNRARRATETKIVKQAGEMIEKRSLAGDSRRAIVLASNEWHAGVIGIVAGRLTSKFHRPTVLVAVTADEGQGSARSIPHFDLAAALTECAEHLIGHGGHAMAAGLRIAADRIEAFTEAFVALANNRLTGDDLVPKLRLDAEVPLSALTAGTVRALHELGPFGMGNPKPLLATDWVELASEPRCVGTENSHLQASFRQNGAWIRAIGFGLGNHIEDLKQHRRCRVAFEPVFNEFNGRTTVEMHMVDLQFPGG